MPRLMARRKAGTVLRIEHLGSNMAKTIVMAGNTALKKVSTPVPENLFGSKELTDLSETMLEAMLNEPGVGLAAPQICINWRVITFGVQQDPRIEGGGSIPYTTVINPSIDFYSPETESDYEACLSVGNLCALVPRAKKIIYSGFDINGMPFTREASGFEARIIQHEYDHLNGILFLERVEDKRSFTTKEELVRQRT